MTFNRDVHYEHSDKGPFISLYHLIAGHREELGYITRGPEGLLFTSSYRRALDANQLWQIQVFMIDHQFDPIPLTFTPTEQRA